MKMKTKQSHIKKLSIIETAIRKLIQENEKLKAENKKLRERIPRVERNVSDYSL